MAGWVVRGRISGPAFALVGGSVASSQLGLRLMRFRHGYLAGCHSSAGIGTEPNLHSQPMEVVLISEDVVSGGCSLLDV